MVKSLIPSALLVNIYWQKLLPSLLVQLVALDAQLVAPESAEVQLVFLEGRLFWSVPRRSGWQNVHSTASIPAGKADNTGNSPKHGNSKQDAVMADKCTEISEGGKSPARVSHKPDGTRIFESTLHYHRLSYLPTKAEHVWDLPVAFSGLNALTNLLRDFGFLLGKTLAKQEDTFREWCYFHGDVADGTRNGLQTTGALVAG